MLVHDGEGQPQGAFGRFGSARGQFVFPVGVAIGPEGTVLVLDRLRHAILLFDAEQHFLAEYGSFGGRPGQFYHPNAIAAMPDGRVVVTQGYLGRVQSFRLYDASERAEAAHSGAPAWPFGREQTVTRHDVPRGCSLSVPAAGANQTHAIDFFPQCLLVLNPTS